MITGQVARRRYETAKRLVQSAINIQAGIRGMSARLNFRTRKQTKAAKMQVNTCNDIGTKLMPKFTFPTHLQREYHTSNSCNFLH